MCTKYCVEGVDRTLRLIMKSLFVPFGGECIILISDFRQIPPAMPRGSGRIIVHLCLKFAPIFAVLILLQLTNIMRLLCLMQDTSADPDELHHPHLLSVEERKLMYDERSEMGLTPLINVVKSCCDLVNVIWKKFRAI